MSAPKREWLRPSALPKLARCGHYQGDPVAGEAADRGTKLDVVFRALIQKQNVSVADLDEAERTAVKWAESTAWALAGNHALEARESELRIEAAGMTGTADLLCEGGRWSADLKTGQIRNYREQQAAYALGFMDRYLVDEWTVYLLFCDAEQVETLRFTLESATEAISQALALYNGSVPPQANEYCGWCVKRFDCPARRESLGILPDFREIDFTKAESTRLRDFVLAAKVVDDFAEKAREELLARAVKGEKVEGVSFTANGRKTRTVANEHIMRLAGEIPVISLVEALGTISESKAKALLGEHFRADMVTEVHGSAYVTIKAPKAAK